MFVKVIASQSNIVFRHGVDLFMLHVIFWAEKNQIKTTTEDIVNSVAA